MHFLDCVELCSFYIQFFKVFFHERMLLLWHYFSISIEIILWFYPSLCWSDISHLLICIFESFLCPRTKSHLVQVGELLDSLFIGGDSMFGGHVSSVFLRDIGQSSTFVVFFSGFGSKVMLTLQNELERFTSISIVFNNLNGIWWVLSVFPCWEALYYWYKLNLCYWFIRFFYFFFLPQFGQITCVQKPTHNLFYNLMTYYCL